MKFVAVVAVIAFVAVQFSQAAPTPEEEKKDAAVAPAVAAAVEATPQPVAEVKAGTSNAAANAEEAAPQAEEKA